MITFFAGIFVAFGDIMSSYTANLRLLLHSKSARFDILYIARLRQVLSGIESGLSLGSLGTCRKCNQISQRRVRTHRHAM